MILGGFTGSAGTTLGLICFLALGTSLIIFTSTTTGLSCLGSGTGTVAGTVCFTGGTVSDMPVSPLLITGDTGLPSPACTSVTASENTSKMVSL